MSKLKCQGCGKTFQIGKYASRLTIIEDTHLVRLEDSKTGILKWEGHRTTSRFSLDMCGWCRGKILDFYKGMLKSKYYARYRRLECKGGKLRIESNYHKK